MNFKTQETKKIIIKSPLIPLFQRGKLLSPPFGKGRSGGIFKTLKCYEISNWTKNEWRELVGLKSCMTPSISFLL